jgi:hypothetical protein
MPRSSKAELRDANRFAALVRMGMEADEITDPGHEPDPTSPVDPISACLANLGSQRSKKARSKIPSARKAPAVGKKK